MSNTKIKPNRKKRILCLFFVFLLIAAMALPCFAWTYEPSFPESYFYFYEINNDTGEITYYYYEWNNDGDFGKAYDFTLGELPSDLSQFCAYIYSPSYSNYYYPTDPEFNDFANFAKNYYNSVKNQFYSQGEIIGTQNGIVQGQQEIYGYFSDSIVNQGGNLVGNNADIRGSIENSLTSSKEKWTDEGYDEGFDEGKLEGVDVGFQSGLSEGRIEGYNQGYTAGVNEADVAENYLLTLFSAPTYILSTIFNFEIFGINIYLLITFLFTIAVIGIVLKKIL